MELTIYRDIGEFSRLAEPVLYQSETENNLMLGILGSIKANTRPSYESAPWGAVFNKNGDETALLLQTPPKNLIFSASVPLADQDFKFIAEQLHKQDLKVPGVISSPEVANGFAQQWDSLNNATTSVEMNQRIYRLENVDRALIGPGCLSAMDEGDLELLKRWILAFQRETGIHTLTDKEARELARLKINNKEAYVLQVDSQPVSMAWANRSTKNGVVISGVYTPDEFKRRGYATTCVAALSQKQLDKGYKFCSLYTDLSNPTSNGIYMKIGYQPIADSVSLKFET